MSNPIITGGPSLPYQPLDDPSTFNDPSSQDRPVKATHQAVGGILAAEIPLLEPDASIGLDVWYTIFGKKAFGPGCVLNEGAKVMDNLIAIGVLRKAPVAENSDAALAVQSNFTWFLPLIPEGVQLIDHIQRALNIDGDSKLVYSRPAPSFHANIQVPHVEEDIALLLDVIGVVAYLTISKSLGGLEKPRRFMALPRTTIEKRRKPDIVVLHTKHGAVAPACLEWNHIAAIGEVKYADHKHLMNSTLRNVIDLAWFVSMASFSRRFVIGFMFCGSKFTITLTDRGGNATQIPLNMHTAEGAHSFICCIAHMALAFEDQVGDDPNFTTFGLPPHVQMVFPGWKTLRIMCRLFHSASFTGRGTQVFLAAGMSDLKTYVVKDSWPTLVEAREGYIIKHIRAHLQRLFSLCLQHSLSDEDLERICGLELSFFPNVVHEYFCEAPHPNTGEMMPDSTNMRRYCAIQSVGGARIQTRFERRFRYRLVYEDVVVESTWFSSRREYFTCILQYLLAHQFACTVNVLHKDITPFNLWIKLTMPRVEAAVSLWVDGKPPSLRPGQLGDFGLAFRQGLKNFPIIDELEKPKSMQDDGQGYSGVVEQLLNKVHLSPTAREDIDSLALDRSGSPKYMATAILADPFGQKLVHDKRHDLEGFWWTIFWTVLNTEGPYCQMVEWGPPINGAIPTSHDSLAPITRIPPWLRQGGFETMTYQSIVDDRLETLGNWRHYKAMISPFWHDDAIIQGLEKMFNIFMNPELLVDHYPDARRPVPGQKFVPRSFIDENAVRVTHQDMISIIESILAGMKDESAPSSKVVERARAQYQAILDSRDVLDVDHDPVFADNQPSPQPPSSPAKRPKQPSIYRLRTPAKNSAAGTADASAVGKFAAQTSSSQMFLPYTASPPLSCTLASYMDVSDTPPSSDSCYGAWLPGEPMLYSTHALSIPTNNCATVNWVRNAPEAALSTSANPYLAMTISGSQQIGFKRRHDEVDEVDDPHATLGPLPPKKGRFH